MMASSLRSITNQQLLDALQQICKKGVKFATLTSLANVIGVSPSDELVQRLDLLANKSGYYLAQQFLQKVNDEIQKLRSSL